MSWHNKAPPVVRKEVEENEDHLIYGTSRVSRSKILDAPIEEGEDNIFLE